VLVPQSSGRKTIPAIRLPHFVPGPGEYRVADSGELSLDVGEAVPGAEEAAPPSAGISRLGTDIRYIREPRGTLAVAPDPVYARPWFLVLQLVPLVGLAVSWAWKRRRDTLAADHGLAKYVRASSRARKALREARAAGSDRAAVCSSVSRAVTDFIGDRLGVAARGMTLPEIEAELRAAGADDALVDRVRALLANCDLGRFAGGADTVDGATLLGEAEACLTAVGKLSRKRRR